MGISLEAAKIKFGDELRKLRLDAGLTQRQLARIANLSQSQVSSMESGRRTSNEEQIALLDDALDANGRLRRRWHDGVNPRRGYAAWFEDIVSAERQAIEIRQYHPTLVPGLLQTEAYAREISKAGTPEDPDPVIEEGVQARIARQAILYGDLPPWYRVVLDELWLHRPTGGREIMRRQLEAVLTASQLERVTIQVIPTWTTRHPGHDGAFKLIRAKDKGEFVYIETRRSGISTDDPDEVADHARVFSELRGASLPEDASRDLIQRIVKEFE